MASPKLPVGPWLNWIESTFLWKAEGWEVRLQDFTMLEMEGNLFNILGMLPKLLLLFLFYKGWYNTSLGELFLVPLEEPEENFIYLFIHSFLFLILGIEPKTSYMLNMYSTTELPLRPWKGT